MIGLNFTYKLDHPIKNFQLNKFSDSENTLDTMIKILRFEIKTLVVLLSYNQSTIKVSDETRKLHL